MTKKKTEIVSVSEQKLGLNEKLKNVKFEEAFDTTTVQKAEQVVKRSEDEFKKAVEEDFSQLKETFERIAADIERSQKMLDELQETAFSIKSRADTGGYGLASDVARSLFEFCEKYMFMIDSTKFITLKLHVNALDEIFKGKFDMKNKENSDKLLNGLYRLVQKSAEK